MQNTLLNVPKSCRLHINGNGNLVQFGKNCVFNADIYIGYSDCQVNNCKIIVGDNTTCNSAQIGLCENNSQLIIGNDCMFSFDVYMFVSDTHAIFDSTGKLVNKGTHITIGNHVWLGWRSTILKNTTIADNSIVGMNATLAGKNYDQIGSIIVGNPGKTIKTGMNWSRLRPDQYESIMC